MESRSSPLITTVDAGRFELGEGPVWDSRTGCLLWVDITAGTILRHDPARDATWSVDVGEHVGSIALTERPDVVVAALRSGWHDVDLATGTRNLIAVPENLEPGHRFNDGAVDPRGRLWTGTLEDSETRPVGGLHRLDRDLSTTTMDTGFVCSNGIDWSPDGEWMYFVDSGRDAVYRYSYDVSTGAIGVRELFIDTSSLSGIPDGIRVDADGALWCAFWDGSAVRAFDPAGNLELSVELPVLRPTSLAFGGADLATMYVTTASIGLDADRLAEWPASGSVLSLPAARPGRPANIFERERRAA